MVVGTASYQRVGGVVLSDHPVYDMSLAYFNVPVHETMIALFKTPAFSVLELFLGALLVFHAVNGVRVALLDLKPELWAKQQLATRISLAITAVILAPT